MIIIVGLGNPGKKYINTRHNIGFRIVDEFAAENNFPEFKFSKKYNVLISEKKEIILAKPQTFMNLSGKSVKKMVSSFPAPEQVRYGAGKFQVSSLMIIHDDIDLLLGKVRVVKNRGAAGHKGVESVIKELGSKNFIRFRIGILPQQTHGLVRGTEKFVLQKFDKTEEKIIKEVIKKTLSAIDLFLKDGLEKTMNEYNK